MQVILLCNVILSISMLSTNGFPQDDAPNDDEVTQNIPILLLNRNTTDGPEDTLDAQQQLTDNISGNGQGDEDYGPSNDGKEGGQKITGSLVSEPNRNKPEPGFDLTEDEIVKFKIWPSGLIPYYIDVPSFSDKALRDKIRSFLSSVNSLTSLNFEELPRPPAEDDSRWVLFINRKGLLGCADHSVKNLTNTGVQRVVLGYDCMRMEGELAEAVLAIAGVPAQHTAPNRDKFIKVNNENIMPDKKYLFEKLKDNEWLFHKLQYDFNSASHYHSHKYSVNGRATVEARDEVEDTTIGGSIGFTSYDILKIRMLYNFIVKKKLLQAPECHKLFVPGSQFHRYKPRNINKPRPKPNKYLGKEDDDVFNQEDGVSKDKNKDSNQHDSIDNNVNEDEERKDVKNNNAFNEDKKQTITNSSILKLGKRRPKKYKFARLSDYNSDG